jgi:hypothetical protein
VAGSTTIRSKVPEKSLTTPRLTARTYVADMKVKYKETSRGGLAVNVIEC